MIFLIISLIVLFFTLVGYFISLGLWAYSDAKVRTDSPGLWTLIVLISPNMFGLIIYLLLGRKKTAAADVKTQKKIKKLKISVFSFAGAFLLSMVLFIVGLITPVLGNDLDFSEWITTSNGASLIMRENYWDGEWSISCKWSTAEKTKTFELSQEELDSLYAGGECTEGEIYLILSQEDNEKTVLISDERNKTIDVSEFKPGKIKLTLQTKDVDEGKATVGWRVNTADRIVTNIMVEERIVVPE